MQGLSWKGYFVFKNLLLQISVCKLLLLGPSPHYLYVLFIRPVVPVVMYGCESWTIKKAECRRIDAFELWCWRRLLRVPRNARRSILGVHWKDWCWSWNSDALATWCEELTHWKRPWWWIRLRVGGEGDDRGWDGWMASPTQWTWVWVDSGSWWWTGRLGVLQFMGSQRVGHDWVTELNCFHILLYIIDYRYSVIYTSGF